MPEGALAGGMGGGMRPADFAAMMNGNEMGNCGWWWVVILFFAMMWGGNGMWCNNGFQNAIGYENLATSNEVQRGFDNQNSMANEREILASINSNALQGMQNANQNTQYMTSMLNDKYNELQRDIAGVGMMQQQAMANQNDCCCSTKMLIQDNTAAVNAAIAQNRYEAALSNANLNAGLAQGRYEAAMNTSSIIQAIQQEGSATREAYQRQQYDALREKYNDLNLQANLAGVVRYPMSTAYSAGFNPFCNCACGGMM